MVALYVVCSVLQQLEQTVLRALEGVNHHELRLRAICAGGPRLRRTQCTGRENRNL